MNNITNETCAHIMIAGRNMGKRCPKIPLSNSIYCAQCDRFHKIFTNITNTSNNTSN